MEKDSYALPEPKYQPPIISQAELKMAASGVKTLGIPMDLSVAMAELQDQGVVSLISYEGVCEYRGAEDGAPLWNLDLTPFGF